MFEDINPFVRKEDDSHSNPADYLDLIASKDELQKENNELKIRVANLLEKKEVVPFEITIGDPTPEKMGERKVYVAEVAGFHKTYLHKKLMSMVNSIHVLFENEHNLRDQDLMLKGAIYAFRELDRWGDMMISERVGYESDEKLKDKVEK